MSEPRLGPASASPRISISLADWGLLILLSTLWGGSYVFAKIAVAEIPPFTGACARAAIGALLLFAVMRVLGHSFPKGGWSEWRPFIVLATCNNTLPFVLIYWSQLHIASGMAAILNATAPFFTVLLAHLLTADDKLSVQRAVGLVAGFAGVAVMVGPSLMTDGGFDVLGQGAVLLTALSYAIGGIYGRRHKARAPLVMAAAQFAIATAMLAPLALIVDRPWTIPMPSLTAIAAVVAMGTLSSAFAYVLYFHILSRIGATNAMLTTFLQPVTAILLAGLLLGERLAPIHLAGMAAIAIGLASIDGRPAAALARRLRLGVRPRAP